MVTIRVEHGVVVRRDDRDIFAFLSDFSNTPQWIARVSQAQKASPGPVRVGTRFRIVSRLGKRTYEREWEVVEYAPPVRLALRTSSPPWPGARVHTIEATPDGCRVAFTVEVRPGGPLAPIQSVRLRRRMDGIVRDELQALKHHLETPFPRAI